MKNYFKVGQEVWYLDEELKIHHGEVIKIKNDMVLKILVSFELFDGRFTSDGRISVDHNISLFQTKPIITENVPIFEERPAYFWDFKTNTWTYGVLDCIYHGGWGCMKGDKRVLYKKWQYEKPELI